MPHSPTARRLSPKETKKARILRAAIDVFADKGFFAARMTDVAKEAQVADGTLYLYFEGKENLLLSIFEDVLSRFIERLRSEIVSLHDPVDKLRVMVRLHLETLGRDRALASVLQIEMRNSRRFMSEFARGRLGEYLSMVREIIEEGQETGIFRPSINSALATNVIFGAVDEMATSWLLADSPYDLLRNHHQILEILCQGMVPCQHHEGVADEL